MTESKIDARHMAVHQLFGFPRSTEDLHQMLHMDVTQSAGLSGEDLKRLQDLMSSYHSHNTDQGQCSSMVMQLIQAPTSVVWSVVRQFDKPQAYKQFIRRCSMYGDGQVGSTREVELISGLPAASSTERLEILDDEHHIFSFKILGGQHRLQNYQSVTTLREVELDKKPTTIVVESYIVDVPHGNTREETCMFADTIVKLNLRSLARISEHQMRLQQQNGSTFL